MIRTASPRTGVLAAVALYLVVGVLYQAAVPAWESPDEPAHVSYVEAVARGELPTSEETYEAYQPPLYYLWPAYALAVAQVDTVPRSPHNTRYPFAVAAYLHPPADPAEPTLRLLRAFSGLLGALVVVLVWATVRAGRVAEVRAAPAAALFVALLPQFGFISHAVTNDALAAVVGGAITYGLVRWVARPSAPRRALTVAGVGLSAAVVTKVNALALWPAVLAAAALAGRAARSKLEGRAASRSGLRAACARHRATTLAVGVALLFVPFTVAAFLEILLPDTAAALFSTVANRAAAPGTGAVEARALLRGAVLLPWSFWARFGWFSIPFPWPVDAAFASLAGLALTGLLARLRAAPLPEKRTLWLSIAIALFMYACAVGNLVYDPQPQGRFLFPALTAIALLVGVGYMSLMSRRRRAAALVAAVAALLVANLYATVYVLPRAYESSRTFPPAVDTRVLPQPWRVAARLAGPTANVRQSFLAREPGLRRAEVAIAQVSGEGKLEVRLTDAQGATLARNSYALRDLEAQSWIGVATEPIRQSGGRRYALELHLAAEPNALVSLWGGADDAYREGTLYVNGHEEPTDLILTSYVEDP